MWYESLVVKQVPKNVSVFRFKFPSFRRTRLPCSSRARAAAAFTLVKPALHLPPPCHTPTPRARSCDTIPPASNYPFPCIPSWPSTHHHSHLTLPYAAVDNEEPETREGNLLKKSTRRSSLIMDGSGDSLRSSRENSESGRLVYLLRATPLRALGQRPQPISPLCTCNAHAPPSSSNAVQNRGGTIQD